jgi:hypothetical protein
MEQSTKTSIGTRTRSHKNTAQYSPPHDTPSTAHQETSEHFSTLITDTSEIHLEQQGNSMEQMANNMNSSSSIPGIGKEEQPTLGIRKEHGEPFRTQETMEYVDEDQGPSYLNIQLGTTTLSTIEKSEMKKEKFTDALHSNIQLQH